MPTPVVSPAPSITAAVPLPTETPLWADAARVMNGLCFEAVNDAAGRAFVIRSEAELTEFYDLADHSELCRRPVRRESFDFSGGRTLVGVWSRGVGCTARHEVTSARRDDVARTYSITLRLLVEGSCAYELVRPFWIALDDVAGYDIRLLVR